MISIPLTEYPDPLYQELQAAMAAAELLSVPMPPVSGTTSKDSDAEVVTRSIDMDGVSLQLTVWSRHLPGE